MILFGHENWSDINLTELFKTFSKRSKNRSQRFISWFHFNFIIDLSLFDKTWSWKFHVSITRGGYGWRTPFLPSHVSLSRINSAQSGMETWLYNWIAFTGQIYACPRHCFRTGIDFSRDCVPTDGKKEEEKKKEETRQFFVFLFVRFRYAND